MELFLAQNHSPMTHLPIATAILGAIAALAALITHRKEATLIWALLAVTSFVTVLPTVLTGIFAAKGRFNDDGKPYIQSGIIVSNVPANARIFRHQALGLSGTAVAAILAALGVIRLRGRVPNQYLVVLLAVILAILWGLGGHLGGEELWGPDTFPGFH
jgi:uncharacterized membrane protein